MKTINTITIILINNRKITEGALNVITLGHINLLVTTNDNLDQIELVKLIKCRVMVKLITQTKR